MRDFASASLPVLGLAFLMLGLWYSQNLAFSRWFIDRPSQHLMILAATLAVTMLFCLPVIWLSRRPAYIYLMVLSILTALLFTAQAINYQFNGTFLAASSLAYGRQATSLWDSIKTLSDGSLVFYWINIPVLVVAYGLLPARKHLSNKKHQAFTALFMLALAAATVGMMIAGETKATGSPIELWKQPYDYARLINKIGLTGYAAEDSLRYLTKGTGVSKADKAFLTDWAKKRPPVAHDPLQGVATGRNLIFIQTESLMSFAIHRQVEGQDITPNLNRLADEGIYVPNYYYEIGPGTTADAEFSAQNSLYPTMDSVPYFSYPGNDYQAMPEFLRAHGYAAVIMHGDEKTYWNRSAIYPQLGYERFYGINDYKVGRKVGFGRGLLDEDFFSQSTAKLEELKQPFAANLITITSHTPFVMPADLKTLKFDETKLDWIQANYIQSIHYTDWAIGQFIEGLKRNGLYDKSLIVINGDHQGFIASPDDTAFANFLGLPRFDQLSYLQTTQVPFIALAPGTGLKGQLAKPGSHIDIYPSIASWLGFEPPRGTLGSSLTSDGPGVATVRRNGNGYIQSIVGEQLIYLAGGDGQFDRGQCLQNPSHQKLDISVCRGLYKNQSDTVRASDITVKGNLIKLLR